MLDHSSAAEQSESAAGDFAVELTLEDLTPSGNADTLEQSERYDDLPALDVGTPGSFSSSLHGHNEKSELSPSLSQPTEANSADFLAMLDDPMPESMNGGSAEVQSMFVEEVLRGVKTPETGLDGSNQQRRDGEFLPKSGTSNDITFATALNALAMSSDLEQPDSPRVSEIREKKALTTQVSSQESTQVIQGTTKISVPKKSGLDSGSQDQDTKVIGKSATEKNNSGKFSGKKEKSSKKSSSSSKKVGGTKESHTEAAAPIAEAATPVVDRAKLRKELRIALGVLVASVFTAAGLIFTKKYALTETTSLISRSTNFGEELQVTPPIPPAKEGLNNGKTREDGSKFQENNGKSRKGETGGKVSNKSLIGKSVQSPLKPKQMNAQEVSVQKSVEVKAESADESGSELPIPLLLTRPNSRYTETDPALRPLLNLVGALDKVQPRKVLSQLKKLPEDYASANSVERIALREVTARYYLQVGAYAKSIKLFREICLDPAGVSELEVCLHAARGFVVTDQTEEADALLEALRSRAAIEHSLWWEWGKILYAANALVRPSAEKFIAFIDEFAEKAPFMTSEWNLQLSTFFARKFSALSRIEQLEILKKFDKSRRKTVEIRFAPLRYGTDIGSYMLPAFLNMYFRLFEMPELFIEGEVPETDSEVSLVAWTFFAVSQSKANEPRQTRARLAPLFAERTFAPLARVIEANLAAEASDFLGASTLIAEQISLQPPLQFALDSENVREKNAAKNFLTATQRFEEMPFLYVEWLYLGVKVAAGLNDLSFMSAVMSELEGVSKRFPEVVSDFQYWNILSRGYKALGKLTELRKALIKAESVAATKHELGFITGYKIWLNMKSRKIREARALMKEGLRLYPHHARLLEFGAEFASQWGESPSLYLNLESEIPRQFQNRGRDRTLLSVFTVSKLLNKF